MHRTRRALVAIAGVAVTTVALATPASADGTFLGSLTTISTLASTVPHNGDVNPYGLVVVPRSEGRLHAGWLMVSNFNAASNEQGTGTTLMQISPDGSTVQQFARIDPLHLPGACPGGVGLTTALSVLSTGWVIVGSLPTSDGTAATAKAGCLLVLDSHGTVRETITNRSINGPWDMTAVEGNGTADLFVTNVLNGTVAANGGNVNRGTVVRVALSLPSTMNDGVPSVTSTRIIGSGFTQHSDPAALVVGPTGVAFDPSSGSLYVADTASNRISVIPHALTRAGTAFTGNDLTAGGSLNSPLGIMLAPNGDVISVNAGDGFAVETDPAGDQVATAQLDSSGSPAGAGALFGLAVGGGNSLFYVDDAANTLNLLH